MPRQLTTEQLDAMIRPAMREARLIYEFKRIDEKTSKQGPLYEGTVDKLSAIFKVGKTRDFEMVGRALAKVYHENIGQLSDAGWRKLLEVIAQLISLVDQGKASPEQLYLHVLRVIETLKKRESPSKQEEPEGEE